VHSQSGDWERGDDTESVNKIAILVCHGMRNAFPFTVPGMEQGPFLNLFL